MSAISRREARRAAVFMLFQWDVTGRPLGSLYEGEVDAYTLQLADAVTEHAAALDDRITSASDDWTADRLGAVERNVLRVALEELDAILGHLSEREHGVNTGCIAFSPELQAHDRVYEALGLRRGRPVWVLFTSSDDEVAAVVTYIRTSWGNRGEPVSARQANELRSATLN